MYAVLPMRTRSNESPLVDIEPFAWPFAIERSSLIGVPPETMFPETRAELAPSTAAFASASTLSADLDASPFELSEELWLPQPASSTPRRTRARAEARIRSRVFHIRS